MKENVLVIISHILLWPCYLISFLLPKKRNLWIFGAWQGEKYCDNSKYLFEYVLQQHSDDVKAIWITKSRALIYENNRSSFCYAYSPRGLYYQLRAGVVFFTHGYDSDFVPALIAGKTRKYQLWHGSPIKKIRYDDKMDKRIHSSLWRFFIFVFPWRRWDFDFIPASSSDVQNNFQSAFLSSNVYVTGYPRNDILKKGSLSTASRKIKRVLFAPTFRGLMGTEQSHAMTSNILVTMGFDVALLSVFLENRSILLTLRMHPSNIPSGQLLDEINKADNIIIDTSDDIYDSLDQYDVLVTDYSSLFLDFMLTGNPVIHAAFDLDSYLTSSREMYYDYLEEICLTPEVRSWSSVLNFLSMLESKGLSEEYKEKYNRLNLRFNSNIETSACKKIFEHVNKE